MIDSQTFSGACLFQRVPCCILKSNGPRSIYTQRSFYLFRSLLCFDSPFPTSIYFFLVHFAFDFVARRYLVSLHKPPPCIRFDFFSTSFFSRSFLFLFFYYSFICFIFLFAKDIKLSCLDSYLIFQSTFPFIYKKYFVTLWICLNN